MYGWVGLWIVDDYRVGLLELFLLVFCEFVIVWGL